MSIHKLPEAERTARLKRMALQQVEIPPRKEIEGVVELRPSTFLSTPELMQRTLATIIDRSDEAGGDL